MMQRRAAAVTGVMLSACAPQVAYAVREREIVRLDSVRRAPAVLAGGADPAALRMRFELPPGARQGPERWYLVRLRYRLWFERDSGPGFAWVTSDTNDRTAAQIEYTTARRGGRLSVRRTTVDLVHGERELRTHSGRDALTFTNHLPYAGVRAGTNTWTIRLEQTGRTRVRRLEVLGDSAIVQTRRTPFPLALTAALDGTRPHVGERFEIEVRLAAAPRRTIRDVAVRAHAQHRGVELLAPARRRVGDLTGRSRTVRFAFLARQPGAHAITLMARSDANDPNAGVQVEVLPAARATTAPATTWALVSLPALAMAGWLAVARRRRER